MLFWSQLTNQTPFFMRLILFVIFIGISLLLHSCTKVDNTSKYITANSTSVETSLSEEDRLTVANPDGTYGNPLQLNKAMSIKDVLANAQSLEGQRVQVVAKIQESCLKRGCWVNLEQDGEEMKVKVEDGFIVFPKSSVGRTGIFEGLLERIEMDLEQTKKYFAHEAEEKALPFDPETITEPQILWRIKGDAAKIGQ
jgi:hypothetical protein